jgi:hypothetical protein
MLCEHGNEAIRLAGEQRVRDNIDRNNMLFGKTRDGWFEVAFGAGTDAFNGHSDRVSKTLPADFIEKRELDFSG